MHLFAILKRPVITEKATDMQDHGKYTFEVAPEATKLQIKEAVEKGWLPYDTVRQKEVFM